MTNYEKMFNAIQREIAKGNTIQVTTMTHSKLYTRADQFKFDATGIYAQRGKRWDCINFTKITVLSVA